MLKKLTILMAVAMTALLSATAAFAAVTFDPATGEGFVGKGDVQKAFGWNNATMQANHEDVTFTYVLEESMEQDCASNDRGTFTVVGERSKSESVNSALVADSRKKNQYVGWNLTGLGTVIEDSNNWTSCPDGSNPQGDPRIESVEALYANHAGDSRLIWTPPAE